MINLNLNLNLNLGSNSVKKRQEIKPDFPIHPLQQSKIVAPFEEWLHSNSKRGLFLGFRKCGKTDLITIHCVSKWIREDSRRTVIIMTRKIDRARAIVRKIGMNLQSVGVKGVYGQDQIRLTNNKQPTVLALTVNSTTKGWHTDLLICDDPVEPTDEYSVALKNRVDLIYQESKNIATRVFVIGQYVAIDDIYVKLESNEKVEKFSFWIKEAPLELIDILSIDIDDLKQDLRSFGKNYEGVIYPSQEAPFSDIIIGDYGEGYNYALLDPSNGKNDYSAIVYLKDFGDFFAIYGKMYKTDWIKAVNLELERLKTVTRFYWEENTIGAIGYSYFKELLGEKAYRFTTTQNKVQKILKLVRPVKLNKIRIDKNSDPFFISTVKNWSPKAGNNQIDDGIDALAMIVERLERFKIKT